MADANKIDWSQFRVLEPPQNAQGSSPVDWSQYRVIEQQPVDRQVGAPWYTRAIVGLYDDPAQKLQALRSFYRDAQPEGDGNFVYTEWRDGKKRLFNPEGFDVGDVAALAREAATLAGSAGGAIAGTAGATPGAGTIAGAGAGALYAGHAMDAAADWLTGVKRPPAQLAKNMGMDFGLNAAGEGVGAGVTKLLGPSVSRLTGVTADKLAEIAERIGVPLPTRGTLFQSRPLQTVESWLSNTIGGSGIMERAYQNTLGRLGEAVTTQAGALGKIFNNAEELGGAALRAADESSRRLSREAAERFRAVYGGIEREPVAGLSETQRYVQGISDALSDPGERARFLSDPTVARALGLSTSDSLDIGTLKHALTDMKSRFRPGSAIDTATASEAQVGGLLSAMSRDRDAAVSALGRGAELSSANRWYTNEKNMRGGLENIFGAKYTPVDLDLLASGIPGQGVALDAAKTGQKLLDPSLPGNTQRALQAALGGDYGQVAATRLARFGDATPGAQGATGEALFSPSSFLTNWNRSLKTGGEAVTPSGWDDALKLSAILRDAEKMGNPSGTARALQGGIGGAAGIYGYDRQGVPGALGGAGLTVGGPAALAMLMANPKMAASPAALRAMGLAPGLLARAGLNFAPRP